MSDATTPPDIGAETFAWGVEVFNRVVREMAEYGIHTDPGLTLRRGSSVFCYYDLEQRAVYLSVPDTHNAIGRFQLAVAKSTLGFDHEEDMFRFMRLVLPRFIAHELAHHYRHRYGQFGSDVWHEEQVANHLAVALTKPRQSPAEIQEILTLLRRTIAALERGGDGNELDADATYSSALHALRVSKSLDAQTFETLLTLGRAFAANPDVLLKESQLSAGAISEHLQKRDGTIDQFRARYASNWRSYMRTHLRWMTLDLESPECHYVDEFVRLYLNRAPATLFVARESPQARQERAAVASFRANRMLSESSPVAARYFYRRYRALVVSRLEQTLTANRAAAMLDPESIRDVLSVWHPGETDPLEFVGHLLPAAMQGLLPSKLAHDSTRPGAVPADLAESADCRLWNHVRNGEVDEGAATTLEQLALFEGADIFRGLPADVMLELTTTLIRQRVAAGEVIVWQGAMDNDVYLLTRGAAKVVRDGDVIGMITPGTIFGEIAFLTRDKRGATVRADTECECFVLKSSDLRLLGFRNPIVFLELSRALARRMTSMSDASSQNNKGAGPMADFRGIAQRAIKDPEFMKRLIADAKGVLAEEGVTLTPEMEKALRALDAQEIERVARQFAEAKPGAAM